MDTKGASGETERQLEKFLFGYTSSGKVKAKDDSGVSESSEDDDDDIPVHSGEAHVDDDDNASEEEERIPDDHLGKNLWGSEFKSAKKRKAAWKDEDDDDVLVKDVTAMYSKARGKHGMKETSTEKYSKALKRKFQSLMGTPKWADLDQKKSSKDEEDSDDEFFRETTNMLESTKTTKEVPKGMLEFRKLKDLNHSSGHCEGSIIRCVEFHPSATVALVAGCNGAASLVHVDGKDNPKMQSIVFENFPVKTAHFSADGTEFMAGSQHHSHYFVYDLQSGATRKTVLTKDVDHKFGSLRQFVVSPVGNFIAFIGRFGNVHFLDAKSKEKVFSLKMNDSATALEFSPDGNSIYSHGGGGEVYIWDVRRRDCAHRFVDSGCVMGTAVSASPDGRFLATADQAGVVNVYRTKNVLASAHPVPEKSLYNLTTSIDHLKFSPSSEILAMASERKENAIKLFHMPSMSVFANFPSWNFNLKRVNCMDFSLNGGYFSIGNNSGAAHLYRLKHFGSY